MTTPLELVRDVLILDDRPFAEKMSEVQARDFTDWFASDAPPNGWISRPRGGSKTTDAAAIAIADLLTAPDHAALIAVASDQDQARLLLDSAREWAGRTDGLGIRFQRHAAINLATNASLHVLASDAPSALGLRPWRIYLDELTAWPTRDLLDALLTSAHKVSGCRILVTATAGFPSHWSFDFWKHANAGAHWLVMHTETLADWIDPAQIEDMRAHLPAGVLRRFIENQWAASDDALFTAEEIAAATDADRDSRQAGERGQRYVIGVDLGLVNDRTAVAVTRVGGGEHPHVLEHLWVRRGSRSQPVQIEEVEDALRSLHRRFDNAPVHVDPWQLQASIQRLPFVKEFSQTAQSVGKISSNLLSLVRDRRLRLLPHPELRAELVSLIVRESAFGWRFDHPPGGHNDLSTALAIAAYFAEAAASRPPPPKFRIASSALPSGGRRRRPMPKISSGGPWPADPGRDAIGRRRG
ncbi:MAG: terminase large subunit [Actinomycetota bacterium]